MKLRPSQEDIIDGIFENNAQLLVAGMGAGKTAGALHALSELHTEGVIDCAIVLAPPLVASTVWPKEAPKWRSLQHEVEARFAGTPKQRRTTLAWMADWPEGQLRIACLSFHVCQWLKDNKHLIPKNCALVFDETSFLKSARSKNGRALRDIADKFVVRYGLTGTPRPNGWEDTWGQYQMLTADKLWKPFDDWRRRNFMPKDYNGYQWEVHDFRAQQLERDVAPLTTVVDADLDLPPISAGPDFDFEVELPKKARELYDEMEEELIVAVAKNLVRREDVDEAAIIAALSQAVASGKLSQIAQGYIYDKDEDDVGRAVAKLHEAKVEALRDIIHQTGGENLLIWYGYRYDIDLVKRAINGNKKAAPELPRLGGGVSASKGRKYIEAFGRGELPFLLAHPASAAHGIDELKHGGRRMVWFCPTWSAEQYEQALKRLDRPGQPRPVFSHQIAAKRTVDEVKLNRVAYKLEDQAEWSRIIERTKKEMDRL